MLGWEDQRRVGAEEVAPELGSMEWGRQRERGEKMRYRK